MRIQMEPTEHLVTIDGVLVRVWNGITEGGTQCFVFVHRIAVRDPVDIEAFAKELSELPAPVTIAEVLKP